MNRIRLINLAGTAYNMGRENGIRFHDEIHRFAHERVRLCQERPLREW